MSDGVQVFDGDGEDTAAADQIRAEAMVRHRAELTTLRDRIGLPEALPPKDLDSVIGIKLALIFFLLAFVALPVFLYGGYIGGSAIVVLVAAIAWVIFRGFKR